MQVCFDNRQITGSVNSINGDSEIDKASDL